MSNYLSRVNCNLGGENPGGKFSVATARYGREAAADLLNCKPQEVRA